jgi:hypothetical protein
VLGREVVGAVVVGEHADVAELAEEGAAARDFEDAAVVAREGRIEERAVEAARLRHVKTLFGFEHLRGLVPLVEEPEEARERLLAVADEDVVEHRQLRALARLVERPADRAADDEGGVGVRLAQLLVRGDDGLVVLVDAAEDEEVGARHPVGAVEAHVVEPEVVALGLLDVGGERVGPHGHEHRAVLLRLGEERVRRVDEGDAAENFLGHGACLPGPT